jgi:hypothetical protein
VGQARLPSTLLRKRLIATPFPQPKSKTVPVLILFNNLSSTEGIAFQVVEHIKEYEQYL